MVAEGVFARSMDALTGGVVLAAFAVTLGASELEIGLLAAIPFLAQFAYVPAVFLLARTRDRRPLTVASTLVARSVLLAVAAVPFLDSGLSPLSALVLLYAGYATLSMVAGASWQVWVRDLVPRASFGAYFGRRMSILTAVGLAATLLAGQFVAHFSEAFPGRTVEGFAILYVVGALLGYASSSLLAVAPSKRLPGTDPAGLSALRVPFSERNFRRVILFLSAWGFAANLALPFLAVLLLRGLGYGLDVVTGLAAASMVGNILGFRLWAPLSDRFGNKPVLGLCASLFLTSMLAVALLPKDLGAWTLAAFAILHPLLGVATSGLDLCGNNVVLKLAPDDRVPGYLAAASVAKALAAGFAPIVGGVLAGVAAGRAFEVRLAFGGPEEEAVVTALRFSGLDFVFLASFALGLYALHRLLGFEEEGEAPPEAVVRAMRRDVGQVSTVAGMRQFAHLASYVVDACYRLDKRMAGVTGRKPP